MISNEIVSNVVSNVINITLVILSVYAAMFTLKKIINFVSTAFNGIGFLDRIKFKKQNVGEMRKNKKWI